MPITTPIAIARIGTSGTETFSFLNPLSDGKEYLGSSSTLALPKIKRIRHSAQSTKTGFVDQTLTQYVESVMCADGVIRQLVMNVTARVPRDAAFNAALLKDGIGYATALWSIDAERAALFLGYS